MPATFRRPAVLFAITLSALGFLLHWPAVNFTGNFTYDEGVYLLTLKAMRAGQRLFVDIPYSQFPLYIQALDFLSNGPAVSIPSVRFVTLIHLPLLLFAVGWLAFRFFGPLAAMVAMLTVFLDPAVQSISHVILGDMPSVAWAVAAWALAVEGRFRRERPRAVLLILSATAFSIGVQMKALVLPALLPILFSLFEQDRRRMRSALVTWLGGVLTVSAALLILTGYEPGAAGQLQGGALQGVTSAQSFTKRLLQFVAYVTAPSGGTLASVKDTVNWPLLLAGVAMVILGSARERTTGWRETAVWAVVAATALLGHSTVWLHHLVLFSPAVALAVGGFFALALRSSRPASWAGLGLVTIVLFVAAAQVLPPALSFGLYEKNWAEIRKPLDEALRANAGPGDFILSDEPYFVAAAGLSMPSALIDVSRVRINAGRITCADLTAALDDARTRGVIVEKRFLLLNCPGGVIEEILRRFPKEEKFADVTFFHR